MTKNVGLQGIPSTAFYSEPHKTLSENYVRYCFIKVCIFDLYLILMYNCDFFYRKMKT